MAFGQVSAKCGCSQPARFILLSSRSEAYDTEAPWIRAIDEALEKIAQHGGTVTTPKAHIPAGYFAYALDTEGNPFGVWELEK